MHRIDTPTAQKDKFGAGKNGFTRGNPQTGTPATDLDDDYFDMLQEELAGVVEATGVNLEKSKHNQLLTALKALLLSRAHPFADIKADGSAAIAEALSNLGLGTAAKRNVDAGLINGIPDMASFRATVLPNGVFKIDVIGAGGGKQKLVFQWGITATAPGSNAVYNVNEAFPNEILWASGGRGAPGSNAGMGVSPEGTQQIRIQNYAPGGVPENCFWWAIGW
ncbi:hypothetical protein OGV49_13915 [Citrobacter sp. Cb021]|uniref:hypothetical protein n=1 Tax=Citrobacter TaxID=544 RepID=UPI0020C81FB2|nr:MULTISPECIES: hypothetical protein [Citrobacter]MDM3388957.1 hypothetical protein [Citrobacter sp. Cb013]MDM3417116.1 hypothetical protein [Citrobacter sp. Cb021]WFX69153.1 hypothetical protein NFK10_09135 [Citrobacter braakii]